MDSLEQMNEALNYIEENLANDIDFKEVARLAFCSEYHFQRMFSFLEVLRFRSTFAADALLLRRSNSLIVALR